MPIPPLPDEILALFEAAERTAFGYLQSGRYVEATRVYSNQLEVLRDLQSRFHKRLHKGGPFYNLGVALLGLNRPAEAQYNFLQALVEDVFSADRRPDWREQLAYRILTTVSPVSPELLTGIEDTATEMKLAGPVPPEPEIILKDVGIQPSAEEVRRVPPRALPKLPLPEMPKRVGRTVFIGGSFKTIAILRHFKAAVKRRGYVPVLMDYRPPANRDVYDMCIAALDSCDLAIFEVTVQEGQMAEIAHHYDQWRRRGTADPRILLLLQQVFDRSSTRVPQMVPPRYKRRCKHYRVLAVATRHINHFLP